MAIQQKLARYVADLSGLGGFLKPNHPMVNYISKELASGKLKVPSYTPYIAPNHAETPWPLQSAEHGAALAKWNANRQATRTAYPQLFHLNAWLLYRLRFIFSAPQLNRLSIVALHLATTEAIGKALAYDQLLKAHLEELTRARANRKAGVVDFSELLSNDQHTFKLQATHQHAKHVTDPPIRKKEETKEKKEKERTRLPKNEYLGELSGDRRRNAATAAISNAKAERSRSRSRHRSRPPSRSHGRKKPPAREATKQRNRR